MPWGDVTDGVKNNLIEGNIIYNNGNGIRIGTGPTGWGSGYASKVSTVKKNFIINNMGYSINTHYTYTNETLVIENNIISANQNSNKLVELNDEKGSVFKYNTLINTTKGDAIGGSLLSFSDGYQDEDSKSNTVNHNTFIFHNRTGLDLFYGGNTFSNNNIIHHNKSGDKSGLYSVKISGNDNNNFENNYWGTSTESEIQSAIYDYSDDFELGAVDYTPFSTALNTTAPISPPSNVTKSVSGSDVVLNWSANGESDIAGYKLYYGTPTGYSYVTTVDLGNVTTYTVTGGDIATEYALTAYDSSFRWNR